MTFKFFRKYNKYILAVGGTVLMITFLMPATCSNLSGQGGGAVAGQFKGGSLSQSDLNEAREDLMILNTISPALVEVNAGERVGDWVAYRYWRPDSPELKKIYDERHGVARWALLLYMADKAGISAADGQVGLIIQNLDENLKKEKDYPEFRARIAQLGSPVKLQRRAIKHWLIVQQYEDLVLGTTAVIDPSDSTSPCALVNRFTNLVVADLNYSAEAGYMRPLLQNAPSPEAASQYLNDFIKRAERQFDQIIGVSRLSNVSVRRVSADSQERVRISYLPLTAKKLKIDNQTLPPTDEEMRAQFEHYRNNLPGHGAPVAEFGYRYDNRVALEYLFIPYAEVLKTVTPGMLEMREYYEKHKNQFLAPPPATQPAATQEATSRPAPAAGAVLTFSEAHDQVREAVKQQLAFKKINEMVQAIRTELENGEKSLADENGYKAVTPEFKPGEMPRIAEEVQKRFEGPLPEYHLYSNLLDVSTLKDNPLIGGLTKAWVEVDRTQRAQFPEYVASLREFNPPADNPVTALKLQEKIASKPLIAVDPANRKNPLIGFYIFRVIEAKPAETPAVMNEALETRVRSDARQVQAYKILLGERELWQGRMTDMGLKKVGERFLKDTQTGPEDKAEFARRDLDPVTHRFVPTAVGDIGLDAAFVDAVFDAATRALDKEGRLSTDPSLVNLVIPVESKLALYLVQIDAFLPMDSNSFNQIRRNPANLTVMDPPPATGGPLTIKAISERIGYEEIERHDQPRR